MVHSKQVFHFNCVRFNEFPLYVFVLSIVFYKIVCFEKYSQEFSGTAVVSLLCMHIYTYI